MFYSVRETVQNALVKSELSKGTLCTMHVDVFNGCQTKGDAQRQCYKLSHSASTFRKFLLVLVDISLIYKYALIFL